MEKRHASAMRRNARRTAAAVAGLYLAFAAGWIVFSDNVVAIVAESASQSVQFQTIKGLVFVTLSALLIYALVAEALRRSGQAHLDRARVERRLAVVLQTVNDGIWEHDMATDGAVMAGRWTALTGYDPGRINSFAAFDALVHPDDRDVALKAYEEHLAGRTPEFEAEYRVRAATGAWLWLRARGRVINRAPDGAPLLAMGTFTDLTAIKESERRLNASVESLRRSEVEISRFAHATVHDLRQPVRQMVSYAQLLARRGLAPAQEAEYAQYLTEGGTRLTVLLDSLLAAFEQRAPTGSFQRVDLDRVIRQVLDKLGGEIARSSAEVTLGPLPAVTGDPIQLALMFEHIIGNALKFRSLRQAPTVHIDARRDGDAWAITIADNGIGFPPEDAEHLFDAFTRLNPPNEFPGSGMGLALSRSIARHHGGGITATGSKGQGATFTVRLPVVPSEQAALAGYG